MKIIIVSHKGETTTTAARMKLKPGAPYLVLELIPLHKKSKINYSHFSIQYLLQLTCRFFFFHTIYIYFIPFQSSLSIHVVLAGWLTEFTVTSRCRFASIQTRDKRKKRSLIHSFFI